MRLSLLRAIGAASLLCGGAGVALAQAKTSETAAPKAPPEILSQYTRAHDLIDIGGGRKLNLFCMGKGKQTVLFDAGGSDWSAIWALVQPGVSENARACTYDRAGLGYSDPARGPRSPITIVEDLHALIRAAKLATPLVLVGHSLGGFNMKLYSALYPEDVAGIVLVDPTEERWYERARASMAGKFGASLTAKDELNTLVWVKTVLARYDGCAATARAGDLDPASDFYKRCTDPVRPQLGPEIAAERMRIQVKSAYQEAQASEISNSVFGDLRTDNAYAALFTGRPFGDKPLLVVTHGIYDPADPADAASFAMSNEVHAQTAALSRRGRHRIVPNTHHNIQIDAPEAVIAAVREILQELEQQPSARR